MNISVHSNVTCHYITINRNVQITINNGLEYMCVFSKYEDADHVMQRLIKRRADEYGRHIDGEIFTTTLSQCIAWVNGRAVSDSSVGGINYIIEVNGDDKYRSSFIDMNCIRAFQETMHQVVNMCN